jgi:tRNA/tmRNA/rRNA uracil-C5-methylase (TrmA/RlmC/RlmD family)
VSTIKAKKKNRSCVPGARQAGLTGSRPSRRLRRSVQFLVEQWSRRDYTIFAIPHPPSPMPPRAFRSHPFAYHAELELRIDTLTNQGHGLGRVPVPDGAGGQSQWVVMVPFALPGERVRARIFRNQKNYSEADLVAVLEPSPQRIAPRCLLFGTCGGCQYQHLAYSEQLAWKRRQVAELLEHMAGVSFPVNEVIGSPREFGYRSKITPHFSRPKDGGVGAIGFLREGTRSQLVDVPRCEIATEALNSRLTEVRAEARRNSHLYQHGATLLLREDAEGRVLTDARATMVSVLGELHFAHLAGDFFQNNPSILPAFVEYIVDQAASSGARFLVDAYCGSGLFSVAAAGRFEAVAGVEISDSAVAQARANAAANAITNATFLAASAEAIFDRLGFPPSESVVLTDPPRAGCSQAFLDQLVTWRPRCCVYVSCNPATQIRDLRILLSAGFRLAAVQPFDLFPQTKHLECVLTLTSDSPSS